MNYKTLRDADKRKLDMAKSLVPGYLNIAGLDFNHDLYVFRMNKKPEYSLVHGDELIIENAPQQYVIGLYNSIVNFHHKMRRK